MQLLLPLLNSLLQSKYIVPIISILALGLEVYWFSIG
jgi:hypothetical protein